MGEPPASLEHPVVTVIGLASEEARHLPPGAEEALGGAEVVVGGRRQLALWRRWCPADAGTAQVLEVRGEVDEVVDRLAALHRKGRRVCVLASGDPGFFGILRALLRVLDRASLRVLPAPSSVALAFARLGLPWDDASVVSVHGRPLAQALDALRLGKKVAVLTAPEATPQALGAAVMEEGLAVDLAAVASRLGTPEESVVELTVEELAKGSFDPLSVVVLLGPGALPLLGWRAGTSAAEGAPPQAVAGGSKVLAWGQPENRFAHRGAMITKSEVRSVALAKLELPAAGVLWDLGAGSGSVAVEAALLRPGLTVFAVEQDEADAGRVAANASALGATVHAVWGRAPEATDPLPSPDRLFVGGGGLAVLDAAMGRLRPGGRVVATYSAIDRAAAAASLLGNLVELTVQRGERLADGGWRLVGQNPVFLTWGPEGDGG